MAQKKPSGLGRGLGELLEDNAPDIREGRGSVTVKREGESIKITPLGSATITQKELFSAKPKNRSIKSNYKR